MTARDTYQANLRDQAEITWHDEELRRLYEDRQSVTVAEAHIGAARRSCQATMREHCRLDTTKQSRKDV